MADQGVADRLPTAEPGTDRLAYTVDEARRLLGIGETLIYDLLSRGTIRSVKAGRRILIPRAALDEFLAA